MGIPLAPHRTTSFPGKGLLFGECEMRRKVYLVSRRIRPLASSDFLPLKQVLSKPPNGYIPYLKRYGMGCYCGFLIILSPRQIVDELRQYREAMRSLLDGMDSLPSESNFEPDQLVPIGRSIDGDILVVHPDTPSIIHALPRQDNCPYLLPMDLETCSIGIDSCREEARMSGDPIFTFSSRLRTGEASSSTRRKTMTTTSFSRGLYADSQAERLELWTMNATVA